MCYDCEWCIRTVRLCATTVNGVLGLRGVCYDCEGCTRTVRRVLRL